MSAEMRPIGSNGFKLKIKNYAKPAESVFDVPYSFEMQIGYNENGGVQGSLNRVGSVLNAAGAVAMLPGRSLPELVQLVLFLMLQEILQTHSILR